MREADSANPSSTECGAPICVGCWLQTASHSALHATCKHTTTHDTPAPGATGASRLPPSVGGEPVRRDPAGDDGRGEYAGGKWGNNCRQTRLFGVRGEAVLRSPNPLFNIHFTTRSCDESDCAKDTPSRSCACQIKSRGELQYRAGSIIKGIFPHPHYL